MEAGDSLLVGELTALHMREAHDPIFRHLSKIALDRPENSNGTAGAALSLIDRIWERPELDEEQASVTSNDHDLAGSL